MEQEVRALVLGRATRETDGEDVEVEPGTRVHRNALDQTTLGAGMRLPDFLARDAQGIPKTEIVAAPTRDVSIEQRVEFIARPGGCMHAVGNRIDHVAVEHCARHLAVPHGDTVHVVAEVQGEVGEIEHAFMATQVLEREHRAFAEDPDGRVH